jgi:hypothetical protein
MTAIWQPALPRTTPQTKPEMATASLRLGVIKFPPGVAADQQEEAEHRGWEDVRARQSAGYGRAAQLPETRRILDRCVPQIPKEPAHFRTVANLLSSLVLSLLSNLPAHQRP